MIPMQWNAQSRTPKGKRHSQQDMVFAGSLRGMSMREFAQFQAADLKRLVSEVRPWVERDLWVKFDRMRAMSRSQLLFVVAALNKVLATKCPDFPFVYPVLKTKVTRAHKPTKFILTLKGVSLVSVPSVSTPEGTLYFFANQTVTLNGVVGQLGFHRHSVERLMERLPMLAEHAHDVSATFITEVLSYLTLHPTFQNDLLVLCKKTGPPAAYFPLRLFSKEATGGDRFWCAITCLLPSMMQSKEPDHVVSPLQGTATCDHY